MQLAKKIQPSKEGERNYANEEVIDEKEIVFGQEICEKIRIEKVLAPQVFSLGRQERRDRNARDEARQAEKRPQRKESDEPEAGHRHRAFQGEKGREEGSGEIVGGTGSFPSGARLSAGTLGLGRFSCGPARSLVWRPRRPCIK
jgi:hypothetical protein